MPQSFHHSSLASTPSPRKLSGCLKSWGLSLIKGHCLYLMSLMFFWRRWDIVTVLQLLAAWPAGAARLHVSVGGVASTGGVVDVSRNYRVGITSRGLCSILLVLKFLFSPSLCRLQQRARPKCSKANNWNSFLSFKMAMPCKMFVGPDQRKFYSHCCQGPSAQQPLKKRVCCSFAVC